VNDHGVTFRVLGLSAVVLTLIVLMGIWHLGANSMIACGFAGAIFLHLGVRPDRQELLAALITGAGYGVLYRVLGGPIGTDIQTIVLGVAAFAGLGSMTLLAYRALWFRSEVDFTAARDAAILPLFSAGAGLVMGLVEKLWPKTFDLYLYAFDCSLGISPGVAVTRWWKEIPALWIVSTVTYGGLLLFPPLYRAWAMRSGVGREPSIMQSFVVAGLIGFVFYQCCPATGPHYVFGADFPNHLPPLNTLVLNLPAVAGARNAIPSMHTAWALLIWWSAWRLSWTARIVASLLVVFTSLAAIGSGEHYLIDLVVALGVDGLCRRRQTAAYTGFGLTLAWLIVLRTGYHPPMPEIGWVCVAATIVASAACQIPLYRGKHTDENIALSSRLTAMAGVSLVHEHKR
jgi:hypothetical protein